MSDGTLSAAAPAPAVARWRAFADATTAAMPWIVFAIALAVGVAIIDALPVGVVHDDGMYVILAKSLASGHGYHWINVPGAPAATHFPPGYPAVLALLWWVYPSFPANVLLFKLANACFTAVAATGTFRFVRERWSFGAGTAAAFALVTLLGIPTLTLSAMVMSEPLFLALLLIALLFAERVMDGERGGWMALLALGLFAGAVTLVRSQGVALVAALVIVPALRRQFREAGFAAIGALLLVLPWQWWVGQHAGAVPGVMRGNYESYGAWLAAGVRTGGLALLPRAAPHTVRDVVTMFGALAAPSTTAVVRYVAVGVLAGLSLIGVRPLWRRAPVTALTLAIYAIIVVLWPFTPARFVWGIWPLVLLPGALGTRELLAWRPRSARLSWPRLAMLAAALLIAAGYARYTVRGYRGRWWSSIARSNTAALVPLVQWARRTPAGAVLGVEEESTVYLYSGRLALPLQSFTAEQYFRRRTAVEDAAAIGSILHAYPVDLVAVSSAPMRAAARVLATATPPELVLRDSFPGGLVLTPATR